jgi:peptidoglycan/xylan/chitin deacetylase (PgdA/CDA1 family)
VSPGRGTFIRRRLLAGGSLLAAVACLVLLAVGGPEKRAPEQHAQEVAASRPHVSKPAAKLRKRRAPVPVLMYHGVEPPIPGGLPDLFVAPGNFRAQVNALARAGAHGVTMDQVQSAWNKGTRLPAKPVVLTFDDGYRGQVDNAMPAMKLHGWPGVLYMSIANFRPATGLKDHDVRALLAAKWELGAHTFSHPDLRTLGAAELRHEVDESRTWLRRKFDRPVNSFAYPAGMYGPATLKAVRRAGFHNAVTVKPGLASRERPYELNRIRVSASTTAGELVRELEQLGWR